MRNRRRARTLLVIVAAVGVAALAGPATGAARSKAALPSDFDGDGYVDLAIGVPWEDKIPSDWNGIQPTPGGDAGVVNVLYGARSGVTASGDQFLDYDDPLWYPHPLGEMFGAGQASGDFDRDGYADLAVGSPYEQGSGGAIGGLHVVYGSRGGLTRVGSPLVTGPFPKNGFPGALASGDFDGDGFWDLAASNWNGTGRSVLVVFGSSSGLSMDATTTLDRTTPGIPAGPQGFFQFGYSLASGDLDGDGYADLAVGANGSLPGGEVIVFYGDASGLDGDGSQAWSQASPGIADEPETSEGFGSSLAIADLDGDGEDDLAVGVYGEGGDACGTASPCSTGAVHVIYGSAKGLTSEGAQFWHQDRAGVPNVGEDNDRFGSVLAAADFDGDGRADLAIGSPSEDLGSIQDAGLVTVLYGGRRGLSSAGSRSWTQDNRGVPDRAEAGDGFGSALMAADLGRSGSADLVIGVPDEGLGSIEDAGLVTVLYGRSSGLSATRAQAWTQDSPGIRDKAETGDGFGGSFAD